MTHSLPTIERPPALHLFVQEAIRSYIIDNGLQPDDPLPGENELARQLGVSRNSVREAIRALESLGILETRRGSGIYVREFSFEPILNGLNYSLLYDLNTLHDLKEIRIVLEAGMINRVIERFSPKQLERFQETLDKMYQKAVQGEPFPEEDREFHQRLLERLNNKILLRLADIFWVAFHKAAEQTNIRDDDSMRTYLEHKAVVEALAAKDSEGARAALIKTYSGFTERLTKVRKTGPENDND